MSRSIFFFSEDTPYVPRKKTLLREWLQRVAEEEAQAIEGLNYIFCSDRYLLKINQEYLKHDYFTDVITFDYGEENQVSGDVFMSIDRVRDNARQLGHKTLDETHRVMVHGLLHLLGYQDKSEEQTAEIRGKEDYYLTLRPKSFQ